VGREARTKGTISKTISQVVREASSWNHRHLGGGGRELVREVCYQNCCGGETASVGWAELRGKGKADAASIKNYIKGGVKKGGLETGYQRSTRLKGDKKEPRAAKNLASA